MNMASPVLNGRDLDGGRLPRITGGSAVIGAVSLFGRPMVPNVNSLLPNN